MEETEKGSQSGLAGSGWADWCLSCQGPRLAL